MLVRDDDRAWSEVIEPPEPVFARIDHDAPRAMQHTRRAEGIRWRGDRTSMWTGDSSKTTCANPGGSRRRTRRRPRAVSLGSSYRKATVSSRPPMGGKYTSTGTRCWTSPSTGSTWNCRPLRRGTRRAGPPGDQRARGRTAAHAEAALTVGPMSPGRSSPGESRRPTGSSAATSTTGASPRSTARSSISPADWARSPATHGRRGAHDTAQADSPARSRHGWPRNAMSAPGGVG